MIEQYDGVCEEFNIKNKVFKIVTDSAANNIKAFRDEPEAVEEEPEQKFNSGSRFSSIEILNEPRERSVSSSASEASDVIADDAEDKMAARSGFEVPTLTLTTEEEEQPLDNKPIIIVEPEVADASDSSSESESESESEPEPEPEDKPVEEEDKQEVKSQDYNKASGPLSETSASIAASDNGFSAKADKVGSSTTFFKRGLFIICNIKTRTSRLYLSWHYLS